MLNQRDGAALLGIVYILLSPMLMRGEGNPRRRSTGRGRIKAEATAEVATVYHFPIWHFAYLFSPWTYSNRRSFFLYCSNGLAAYQSRNEKLYRPAQNQMLSFSSPFRHPRGSELSRRSRNCRHNQHRQNSKMSHSRPPVTIRRSPRKKLEHFPVLGRVPRKEIQKGHWSRFERPGWRTSEQDPMVRFRLTGCCQVGELPNPSVGPTGMARGHLDNWNVGSIGSTEKDSQLWRVCLH